MGLKTANGGENAGAEASHQTCVCPRQKPPPTPPADMTRHKCSGICKQRAEASSGLHRHSLWRKLHNGVLTAAHVGPFRRCAGGVM